jgi:hypothetical protein
VTVATIKKVNEGWAWPLRASKPHYFDNGLSLCNRWMYTGATDNFTMDDEDVCKACQKALAKREPTS